jgi:hypothetical protein
LIFFLLTFVFFFPVLIATYHFPYLHYLN